MAKYVNPIVYERIEQLVKNNGMVMFDLSKRLNISTGNISDWKSGKAVPACEKLIKIADFFNVPVDFLLGRDKYCGAGYGDPDGVELMNIYADLDREGKVNVLSEAYNQRRRIQNERDRQEEKAEG